MIWRPWRRIRELEAQLARYADERNAMQVALHRSTERYDRIRDTNHELRRALDLYRNGAA